MFSRCAILAWVLTSTAGAQTLIDLRTQSKSVDFTAANTTKPMKTGSVLPVTCGVGEAFFQTNAPAGSNLYLCTSQNSWSLQGGPSGAISHVQSAGATLPLEGILNFTGGGCTDDSANGRTNCNGAGISGLGIAVNGSAQGTQPTLNLISGTGIIQVCANNSGANRVDCTPALDTAFAPSRSLDQAGTDHSIIASSGNGGGIFAASANPTLTAYTQNQTFSFIASDHACGAGATLNIDGLGPVSIKKIIGGSPVSIAAGDCVQGVPIPLRAFGSPVSAFLLSPDGAPVTGWVSNVTVQSTSQSAVTLASSPTSGAYRLTYYVDQNGTCTSGSNSVSLTFNWTDGSNARVLTTGNLNLGSAQTTAGYLSGTLPVYVGSGNVTYSSSVVGSCTSGTSSYDAHLSLERLQ
jgi:hypothetical protein